MIGNVEFLIGEDGLCPTRKDGDVGYDFYVPENFNQTLVRPGEGVIINTHVRSKLYQNIALIAFNKSGVATKKNLQVGACVIDPSYQGEIHLHVYNWSKESIWINPGDKLVQFVPILFDANPAIIHTGKTKEEFYGIASERGEGAFGSTGDKYGQ